MISGLFAKLDELLSEAISAAVEEVLDIELGPDDLARMTTLVTDTLASAVMNEWAAR